MVDLTAEEKLSKGIIKLQKPQPFFAYLLMHLKPKPFPEEMSVQFKTIAVNPKGELYYDKKFVESLTEEEVYGVLCHEVLHVALLHPLRTGSRHRDVANIAQDVLVNMMVMKTALKMHENIGYGRRSNFGSEFIGMKLPAGGVNVDARSDSSNFNLDGAKISINDVSNKAWEEIYSEVIEQLKKQGKSPNDKMRNRGNAFDNHMGDNGKDGDGNPMSAEESRALEQKWQSALAEAAHYAKQQGKLPGGMQRVIDELLKPKVIWKQLLMKYLRPHINPVDWTYQRPHKKSQVLEVFMPRTMRERCEVEVIVDTSGSIGNDELKLFLSEIVAIAQAMSHVKMWVTFVDAKVNTRYEVENGDIPKILSMKASGGGGTDMEAGLDFIKAKNREIPVAIVLTDGYTNFRRKRHDYPFDVIWVITKDGISKEHMKTTIPYGQKVKME